MKILPPHDDQRVYAWIIFPVCLVVLICGLVLGAVFGTWGEAGIYENLFAEAIGVVIELGLIYLLLNTWIERREQRKWIGIRSEMASNLQNAGFHLFDAIDEVLEGLKQAESEDRNKGLLSTASAFGTGCGAAGDAVRSMNALSFAVSVDMAPGFASLERNLRFINEIMTEWERPEVDDLDAMTEKMKDDVLRWAVYLRRADTSFQSMVDAEGLSVRRTFAPEDRDWSDLEVKLEAVLEKSVSW